MYCIECGSPIEATARICGTCRFPQPLEEFADLEPALAGGAPRTVLPVSFIDAPAKPANRTRIAPAIAVFIALCISTGLSVYLLTRQSSGLAPRPSTDSRATDPSAAKPAPGESTSGEHGSNRPATTDAPGATGTAKGG